MINARQIDSRRGARRMSEVPAPVLEMLAAGTCESVNLMEWLAADMGRLALAVADEFGASEVAEALRVVAPQMTGLGVTQRLQIAGRAIAQSTGARGAEFEALAAHRSDLVRQWACYAANDNVIGASLDGRIAMTLRFATDPNMSVRETAWMAFRPHLATQLPEGIVALEPLSRDSQASIRRFAVEVTRPRSVWGAHIGALKADPSIASQLLSNVKADPSRYVQLAVGNWLNDASKSRPDWVEEVCSRWEASGDRCTDFIVRRARRTMIRPEVKSKSKASAAHASRTRARPS